MKKGKVMGFKNTFSVKVKLLFSPVVMIGKIEEFRFINSPLFYTLLIIFIIVFTIILFIIIDKKYKAILLLKEKEIREQTIKELKTDHQLIASRAVLMGEERERGRISRDLHDGLGGRLSGIKIILSNLKNQLMEAEVKEKLSQALDQLNLSITELRMIAHNLMPDSLVNFGLKDALNDLSVNLSSTETEIVFLFYGEPYRFDNSIETSFFRIAQEAINNAIKYASATKIVVQLIQDESWVNLTVQDNGNGFNVEDFAHKPAGGLKNIRSRVESFDGRFSIDSRPGIGTEIIVEFIYSTEMI